MCIYKFQLPNDMFYAFPIIYIPDTLYPNYLYSDYILAEL